MPTREKNKARIRKGDIVRVISGSGALSGQQGKVLKVLTSERKVVVEGINYVYKHIRRSQEHPKGGRIQKEAPVHISNVMLVCPSCQKPSRLRMETDAVSGKRTRVCKKCDKPV